MMTSATVVGFLVAALGTFVTGLNFYLSFLRHPLHCWRGGTETEWRNVSGIPIFGSLLLWFGAFLLANQPLLMWACIVVSLFDTAGIHWAVGYLIYWTYFHRHK